MDGTELVQRLVQPGDAFDYRFELPDAALYTTLKNGVIMFYFTYYVGNVELAGLFMVIGLLGAMGAVALGLAALGTYAILAYVVSQQTREDVLRHYLRIVPYGNRIHGISYAARRYFGDEDPLGANPFVSGGALPPGLGSGAGGLPETDQQAEVKTKRGAMRMSRPSS